MSQFVSFGRQGRLCDFGRQGRLYAMLFLAALTWSCSKGGQITETSGDALQLVPAATIATLAKDEIAVTDELGKAIPGARVLIGPMENAPFKGNFLTADEAGKIVIPGAWHGDLPVTVDAPGYLRATFMGQAPASRVFPLRRKDPVGEFELKGLTSGYTVKNGDGLIDFGLVMSTFSKKDLFNFDIGMVMSPYKDIIEIIGNQVKLPSNVGLPKQTERYIFSITLDKPAYRLYFKTPGEKNVFAARGRFPLDKIIDGYQDGKEIVELVNDFDMLGGTLTQATVAGKSTSLDINVAQTTFSKKKMVKAPALGSGELMLGLSLRKVGAALHPTDVKIYDSKSSLALDHADEADPMLLAALKRRDEMKAGPGVDRVSATFLPLSEGASPVFLPLLEDPVARTSEGVAVKAISAPAGVTKLATYIVLSRVIEKTTAPNEGDPAILAPLPEPAASTVDNAWEIYGAGWLDSVTLPKWPGDAGLHGTLKWEVSMVGSQKEYDAQLGPGILDVASHASHASVDVVVP